MTDPRAYSEEKIVPPEPLPYVSRKALKRIGDDAIPIPTECRYCQSEVALVRHAEIYNGREFGDWPFAYLCRSCRAYVGLHPNTDIPLGTLADDALRKARINGKTYFYTLTKQFRWSRKEAYHWLADKMGIPTTECHWGMFEIEQCQLAGQLCRDEINQNLHRKQLCL